MHGQWKIYISGSALLCKERLIHFYICWKRYNVIIVLMLILLYQHLKTCTFEHLKLKSIIFRNVAPFCLIGDYLRFGLKYCLHLQQQNVATCWLDFLFDSEDVGSKFILSNGKLIPDYTASHSHHRENLKSQSAYRFKTHLSSPS
jgi:hypothetical protein